MKEWICEEVPALTVDGKVIDTMLLMKKELIRCRDCKHRSLYCTEDVCGETLIECNRPDLGDVIEIHGWNWFCPDGEKSE